MQISFATRSTFKDTIVQALLVEREALKAGRVVTIELAAMPEGYPGELTVELSPQRSSSFTTDWEGRDPTRFPARLRAAATALDSIGERGQFALTHRAGTLTVRRLSGKR